MPVKDIEFENSLHQQLFGTLKYPSDITIPVPLVIVLHKLGSHSNQELIVNIANSLYPHGFATFRFDFHGHGSSSGRMQDVHITQAIDDVISAINFCSGLDFIDIERTVIVGHGIGGDIGLLSAARDKRIKCLIMLAPASDLADHLRDFNPGQMRDVADRGYTTHQQFGNVGKEFFRHIKRFDPKEDLGKISIPVLFIHGKNDFQVRWESSKELYFAANEPKRMEIIDDADHYFQIPEHRERVMNLILQWLNHHVRGVRSYEAETTERLGRARLF